jgi:hypothetical protein
MNSEFERFYQTLERELERDLAERNKRRQGRQLRRAIAAAPDRRRDTLQRTQGQR